MDDLNALEKMVYSGRGIIVGMTPNGNSFIGYSLTGRSSSSQARKLKREQSGVIRTDVTDKKQLERGSPALLLYPAIVPIPEKKSIIASNGAQTKLIYSELMQNDYSPGFEILRRAFSKKFFEYDKKDDRWIDITTYEPDEPNNTPRISACVIDNLVATSIIRCKDGKREEKIFSMELKPGMGKLITTYKGGNEKPLLPFEDKPLDIIINSEFPEEITESIYEAIYDGQNPGDDYRIAAATALYNKKTKVFEYAIINRSEKDGENNNLYFGFDDFD